MLHQPQWELPLSARVCTAANKLLASPMSQACTEKDNVVRMGSDKPCKNPECLENFEMGCQVLGNLEEEM